MWESGINQSFPTRYTVEYIALSKVGAEDDSLTTNQKDHRGNPWLVVENCSLITSRTCDLTNVFTDVYDSYFTQVKAVTEMDESDWSFSVEFQPFRDTKIRPVNFQIMESPVGVLKINFDSPATPACIYRLGLKFVIDLHATLGYHISVYKNGELEKNREVLGSTREISVKEEVDNLQPNTQYCVSIKMFSSEEDHSDPVESKCVRSQPLRKSKVHHILIALLIILVFGFAIIFFVLYSGGFLGFFSKYGPQALNNLKHIRPVYTCNNVQEKLSTLEQGCFNVKKIDNIEEDSEEELMNSSEEAGYESNALNIPVHSTQSCSASSKAETDDIDTKFCDDQWCDSMPEHIFTNFNECQVTAPATMQTECPDAESTTQITHSRRNSSTSATSNISDVPLWSIQIQDPDFCFENCSKENLYDQKADESDIMEHDLNDLLSKVSENMVICEYEKPNVSFIPSSSSLLQALSADMRC
ncbi:interferon alpha/beta receptor 2-like isoform X2 [Stegostoma tigrinum]|nr:interferon alpha/beta receptor 2-like isoform X2 [Stegostoma tigrinum]